MTALRVSRVPLAVLIAAFLVLPLSGRSTQKAPVRGLSHGLALAGAYDAVLDADFEALPSRLSTACGDVPTWCVVMQAVSIWWQIALDPADQRRDSRFSRTIAGAIRSAESWTEREPHRAEAWFALGAAYGSRAQWRVLRGERLAAARDGKHIKEALEHALDLDPALHDAKFGIGVYRYYADVAPAALRMLRWLLLLPGGDRDEGLQQMEEARNLGFVIRGEADYQLHLIYLWYEEQFDEALALIRDLRQRYPHNPLFYLDEAEILDEYFDDDAASEGVLVDLIARAQSSRVHAPAIALRRARLALTNLRARPR